MVTTARELQRKRRRFGFRVQPLSPHVVKERVDTCGSSRPPSPVAPSRFDIAFRHLQHALFVALARRSVRARKPV